MPEDKEPIFVMKNGRYSSLEGSFSYKGRNMAYNVRIMEKAEEDLSEIVTYLSDMLCNPKAADSLLEEFLEVKTNLEDNPYMYPLSNDLVLQIEGYHRFLFKKNYIALYLINDDKKEVSIMRIFYAKRDYNNLI